MFVNLLPRKCLTSVNSGENRNFLFTSKFKLSNFWDFKAKITVFLDDGGSLLIFRYSPVDGEYRFYDKFPIFPYSNIHDVKFSANLRKCLISGEKSFAILDVNFRRDERFTVERKSLEIFCDDYRVANCFLDDFSTMAMLFMHNRVGIFDSQVGKFEKFRQCEDKCLLYSGLICDGKIFSGTIFGQILVWTLENGEILQRLAGHKGVIFDLTLHGRILYSVSDDRTCKIWFWQEEKCAETLYGHEARIWGVKCVDGNRVLTCGEDGKIILWDSKECKALKTWCPNRGSIRRMEFLEKSNTIVWGTDYGSLFTVDLDFRSKIEPVQVMLQGNFKVATVCFKNDNLDLICISKDGSILDAERCEVIYESENLKYCCLAKCRDWITVGDLEGSIYFVHKNDENLNKIEKLVDSKILSLNFVETLNNLLITVTGGLTIIYNIELWCKVGEFRLQQQILINRAISAPYYLILGDRQGSLHFLKTENYTGQIFPQIHGKNGVTDLQVRKKDQSLTVASIGRDGCLAVWRLDDIWTMISRVRICPGFEWPSKFLTYSNQDLIAGFKANQFTVYDVQARNFPFTVECGGGHRSYDIREDYCSLQFVYCKQGRVYRSIFDRKKGGVENEILPHLHNRHVKRVLYLENGFFATCSEDTTLAIWCLEKSRFELLRRLKSKFSSILCMDYCSQSRTLCTGGGRGEICIFSCDTVPDFRLVRFWRQNPDGGRDFRYLDLKIDRLSIFACRSDGIIDIFRGENFRHVTSYQTSTCLTRVALTSENQLLSIGTDGRLRFCRDCEFDRQVQIEKSGLTCLDAKIRDNRLICIIGSESGGVSLYDFDQVRTFHNHSSTVTDVMIHGNTVFSLGVDQRIVEWDLTDEGLVAKKCYFTHVADCSSFFYMEDEEKHRSIIVTGVGLQKIEL